MSVEASPNGAAPLARPDGRSYVAPMDAILTILAFVAALAALNLFEFGRLD